MTTETTPEQLAKWREEFEAGFNPLVAASKRQRDTADQDKYWNLPTQQEWRGYLRAKKEYFAANQDILKLAKFGAAVFADPCPQINELVKQYGLVQVIGDGIALLPNVEATMKELLK